MTSFHVFKRQLAARTRKMECFDSYDNFVLFEFSANANANIHSVTFALIVRLLGRLIMRGNSMRKFQLKSKLEMYKKAKKHRLFILFYFVRFNSI